MSFVGFPKITLVLELEMHPSWYTNVIIMLDYYRHCIIGNLIIEIVSLVITQLEEYS